MKHHAYILTLAMALLLAAACTTPQTQIDQHWKAYKLAMKHGDIPTAIVEVNAILAHDTTDQSTLDTILRLYYIKGNHISAFHAGNRISDPSSVQRSLVGESAMNLGLVEEAKEMFLEVEASDSFGLSLKHKYKLATLHYAAEEYDEALAILNKIVKDDKSLEVTTSISGDNSVVQKVVMYSASFNFAGFIFMTLEDFDTAEAYFNEALRVQPDFVLAKNNLGMLSSERIQAE